MAAWSGAVAARLSGDDAMLDDLRAWSAGQFAMFGTRNSALTERYVFPRSLSSHDQARWVAVEAERWVTDNYPGQEAPFVALFAYLALERGERDRAQYLVDSFASRSPADMTLARFVVHRLQGDDPDQTENVADHHRPWSSFDPNTHPERREACRSALWDELARWTD